MQASLHYGAEDLGLNVLGVLSEHLLESAGYGDGDDDDGHNNACLKLVEIIVFG